MTEGDDRIGIRDGIRRSSGRWRIAFFSVLGLLILTVLAGSYALLDQGISYTYLADDLRYVESDFAILRRLTPGLRQGDTRADVLALLRRQNPEALISSTDSTVRIGGLVFRFGADGRLRAVDRPDG